MNCNESMPQKCRAVLEFLYGERLKGVILYGSSARGTDTDESDIDVMVLLDGPVNVGREIFRIWDVLYPLQLETGRVISVMPADAESYRKGRLESVPECSEGGCSCMTDAGSEVAELSRAYG